MFLTMIHCVKSVQIRIFFWSVLSRIRTDYGEVSLYLSIFSANAGKYGPEKLRIWTLFMQWS